uniref:Uncharacterized protein n=1 Tax=Megaselia scalaris TaxID=36166 RepID=T1GUC0_MEGSC
MLPTYSRTSRKLGIIPNKEKCMIGLVLSTLCLLCFAGIFLLPDDFGGEKVLKVVKKFKEAGPDIFIPNIPNPPLAEKLGESIHVQGDRQRLEAKIKNEWSDGKYILDKPEVIKKSSGEDYVEPNNRDDNDNDRDNEEKNNEGVVAPPPNGKDDAAVVAPPSKKLGGKDENVLEISESKNEDPSVKEKAEKVKEVSE